MTSIIIEQPGSVGHLRAKARPTWSGTLLEVCTSHSRKDLVSNLLLKQKMSAHRKDSAGSEEELSVPLEDPEKRPRLPPLSALLSPLSQQERSPPHVSPASSSMTSMSEKRPWSPIHTSGSDPRSTSSSSNLGSRDIFYPKAFENETALSGRVSTFAHSATRLADKEIEEYKASQESEFKNFEQSVRYICLNQ